MLLPEAVELYAQDFDGACRLLAQRLEPYRPDLLVGIATGGAYVAQLVQPCLSTAPTLLTVRVQRPGTAAKEALRLRSAISHLPRSVTDLLRWAEVEYREATVRRELPAADLYERAARLAEEAGLHTAERYERCVIVDDTIDSGRTLRLAEAAVRLAQPQATITTAVLASTWRRPPVRPDVCLFDRTLLRLPWSLDARSGQ